MTIINGIEMDDGVDEPDAGPTVMEEEDTGSWRLAPPAPWLDDTTAHYFSQCCCSEHEHCWLCGRPLDDHPLGVAISIWGNPVEMKTLWQNETITEEDVKLLEEVLECWYGLSNIDKLEDGYFMMTDHRHDTLAAAENLVDKLKRMVKPPNGKVRGGV